MKRHLVFGTVALLLASAAAVGGYWLGFRHGARLGLMANAVTSGAVAVGNLRLLEKGHPESVHFYLESEVDTGLMWWPELERTPLLNVLLGSDVIPGYERYVRMLATYRKAHPSPLDDPSLNQQMIAHIQDQDPSAAHALEEGDRLRRQAIQEVLHKYGQ
jgi:hypothetical protein